MALFLYLAGFFPISSIAFYNRSRRVSEREKKANINVKDINNKKRVCGLRLYKLKAHKKRQRSYKPFERRCVVCDDEEKPVLMDRPTDRPHVSINTYEETLDQQ